MYAPSLFILLPFCPMFVRSLPGTLGVFSGMYREKVDVLCCSDVIAITVRLYWGVQPSFLGVGDSPECFSPFLLRAGGVLVLLRVLL
jgi:hypothetical protein